MTIGVPGALKELKYPGATPHVAASRSLGITLKASEMPM
jgi:hypothetical protein